MNSSVTSQLSELENMRNKLKAENSYLSDNLFVDLVLSKLSPEWSSFMTEMHRMKEQISLDELKRNIHIEDENRARKGMEQIGQQQSTEQKSTANLVSRSKKPLNKSKSKSGESSSQSVAKRTSFKKKKKKGKCFNCGKWGHWMTECKLPKKPKSDTPPKETNILVSRTEPQVFIAMMTDEKASTSSEWWLDCGATCHVANDKGLLTDVTEVKDTVENCNGDEVEVTHTGTANLVLSSGNGGDGGELDGWDPEQDDLLEDDII